MNEKDVAELIKRFEETCVINKNLEDESLRFLVNMGRVLYVELTNCERYSDGGDEIAGHYCPKALLEKFDSLYCAENLEVAGLQNRGIKKQEG